MAAKKTGSKKTAKSTGFAHPTLDDVRGFAGRLAQLRERFPKHAKAFAFDPLLDEAVVAELEARECITLPADYRTFLLHVGSSGGAWPMTGLQSPIEPLTQTLYALRDPFPEPRSTDDSVMSMIGGLLPLGSDGSSTENALVVSGPAHGQVWTYLEEDRPGWVPLLGGEPHALDGRPLKKLKEKERELEINSVLADLNRPLRHSFASVFSTFLARCERGELDELPTVFDADDDDEWEP